MAHNKFILITGMPGVGKTTLIKRIVEELKAENIKFQGFYSTEKRRANDRFGFDIVDINDGSTSPLARISSEIASTNEPSIVHRVGKYVVFVKGFEEKCLPLFESVNENTLLVLDEIGKMELFSKPFEKLIRELLQGEDNLKILATIPLKFTTSIIDDLKRHEHATLFHITKSNRDGALPKIKTAIENLLGG